MPCWMVSSRHVCTCDVHVIPFTCVGLLKFNGLGATSSVTLCFCVNSLSHTCNYIVTTIFQFLSLHLLPPPPPTTLLTTSLPLSSLRLSVSFSLSPPQSLYHQIVNISIHVHCMLIRDIHLPLNQRPNLHTNIICHMLYYVCLLISA